MTDYKKTTIDSPKEAFDRLEEEFFVEERTEEEITVITTNAPPPNDPVFNLIQKMGLIDQFSAYGQGIHHQEDLPEELRDEEQYQEEQEAVTPQGEDWSDGEVTTTLDILEIIKDKEADSDHIQTLEHAQERLQELYGEDLAPTTSDEVNLSEDDVQTALDLLSAEGVEYRGGQDHNHPNNVLDYAWGFVDNEAKFVNGILPEPRGEFADA